MYKLLALDLDGTVLNRHHEIHPDLKKAIRGIQSHYHVMIVTGRHHTAAKPYHAELGLTTPIICCNGTYMYDYQEDKVLMENSLSKQVAQEFLSIAQAEKMKILLYVTDAMLYSKTIPVEFIQDMVQWAEQYSGELKPRINEVDDFSSVIDNAEYIWKFVVEGEPEIIRAFSQQPWVKEHFIGEQSWKNRFDFSAIGNSKGHRLAQYVKGLGLTSEDVVAVGDNHNDISMLTYAGLGVAMENAAPEIKASANMTTDGDHNSDGLARLIRQTFPI